MTTITATTYSVCTAPVAENTTKPSRLVASSEKVDAVVLEFQWGIGQCYNFLNANCCKSGESRDTRYYLKLNDSLECREMAGFLVKICDPSGSTKYEGILKVLQRIYGEEFMTNLPKNTYDLDRSRKLITP